jgi:hypothetical protein
VIRLPLLIGWTQAGKPGNLSKSGPSVSHRRGPVTINSSIRLPFGLSYPFKL